MIPFGSQRRLGQDLATHLLNAHDNERIELAEVRGAIARDLHGAFAEWEVQAHSLTRCRNYLYSLSVNPDPAQGRLTRAQYLDYIDRTEAGLGLSGQPRAVIFHIKDGREHCHVVWSRIDADEGKARHIAFDREKLMMITRTFAREHGLDLPEGYYRDRGRDKTRQLSLYEMHQQRTTGLSKDEHVAQVTAAWRQSDSPKAFVRALEERGYILSTGNRPYVLVDYYGHTNSLPKLIDDRAVRLRDVRAFLEREFPPDSLPSVEESQALAAEHRKSIEAFRKARAREEQRAVLEKKQAARRKKIEARQAPMRQRHHRDRLALAAVQKAERQTLRAEYHAAVQRARRERAARRPRGLAAFLGRVSGVALVVRKVHKYQDRKRYRAFLRERDALRERQQRARADLARRHRMQHLDMQRRLRALRQIEQRELRSLETAHLREVRTRGRTGREQMPALRIREREGAADGAQRRQTTALAQTFAEEAGPDARRSPIRLTKEFARASDGGHRDGDDEGGASSQGVGSSPPRARTNRRRRRRNRDVDRDR